MKEYEKILKALANARRLRILKYLKEKKRAPVGTISGHIKLSFKSTSRHLAILFSVGIVDREQENLSMLYSLNKPLPSLAKLVVDII